jgi:hypothetical protein
MEKYPLTDRPGRGARQRMWWSPPALGGPAACLEWNPSVPKMTIIGTVAGVLLTTAVELTGQQGTFIAKRSGWAALADFNEEVIRMRGIVGPFRSRIQLIPFGVFSAELLPESLVNIAAMRNEFEPPGVFVEGTIQHHRPTRQL